MIVGTACGEQTRGAVRAERRLHPFECDGWKKCERGSKTEGEKEKEKVIDVEFKKQQKKKEEEAIDEIKQRNIEAVPWKE